MPHHRVIIIGGGISGLTAALALTKINHIPINHISVHELRATASTIGGAVNLTPNALRYLDALGVYSRLQTKGCETRVIEILSHRTGGKLGEVSFDNERFGYRAMRVKRGDLLEALLETWRECDGIVTFESKIIALEVEEKGVIAKFADGTEEKATLLLGCDGIHSWVRTHLVEPERRPVYSGIAAAYGVMDITASTREQMPMESTAAIATRRGTLLLSYCNPEKTQLYVAVVMETKEEGSREGWRVKGGDQVAMKQEFLERFGGQTGMGAKLNAVIDKIQEWYLYPVFTLTPRGKWSKGPVIILGDAAHAMPPQGESVGFAIEDTMLFSRILKEQASSVSMEGVIERYERNRRKRIDEAFDEATFRWETAKDAGFMANLIKEYATTFFLWWTKSSRDDSFAFDVRTAPLEG